MRAWNFSFRMRRLTRAPGILFLGPAAMCGACSYVRGLSKNLNDVTVASSQYDLLCSETQVSDRHHISEFLVPGFGRPVLLCWDGVPRARGMAAYVRDGYGAFRQPKFECGFCEMLVFRVCGARQTSMCTVCIAALA